MTSVGARDRQASLRAGMESTLTRLAELFEGR
jgi:hypothetical protein